MQWNKPVWPTHSFDPPIRPAYRCACCYSYMSLTATKKGDRLLSTKCIDKVKDNIMDVIHLPRYILLRKCLRACVLSTLVLCIFLLSACGGTTPQNTTSVLKNSLPTPVIDPSLQNTGDMKLQAFQQWISLMQHYKGDVTSYQQQYTSDQQALQSATSSTAYKTALNNLNTHVAAIQIPAMKTESSSLLQQLQQEATNFGKQHTYHDTYDNTTYPLGYEYGSANGATSSLWLQGEISSAKTLADYQQVVEDMNMNLSN